MDKKYDVFISYSRKDTAMAEKIREAFDAHGITYFIDRLGIAGGLEFPQVIAEAITSSTVFLFLGSKNSYESKFTNSEITFAFNKKDKKKILPYIIDDSQLPINLEFVFSNINIRNIKDHPIETVLVNDILRLLGNPEDTTQVKPLKKKSVKPIVIAAALCAAVIAVGITAFFLFRSSRTTPDIHETIAPVVETIVVPTDPEVPEPNTDRYVGRVENDNVCLRTQPNEDSKLTGSNAIHLSKGELLQVIRVVDNYYQVEYDNAEYYVPKMYLRIERGRQSVADVPKFVYAKGDNVCLRSQPNEESKMTGPQAPHLYEGEVYRCTGIEKGYYAIEYNGSTYYLPMRYAAPY